MLARFPFTDQRGAMLRPVLVLAEIPGRYADFLVVFISSRLSQAVDDLDVILDAAHPAFPGSGLKVPSVIRVSKVASISEQLIAGSPLLAKAGYVSLMCARSGMRTIRSRRIDRTTEPALI